MVKVLHILKTLTLGGAEVNLLNLISATDSTKYKMFVAYSFGGELEPKFKDLGVELFKFADKDYKVKSVESLFIIYRLANFIRKNKIDIVHTHTFTAHIWGALAAKLGGAKIVEHVHDFRYFDPVDFSRRRGISNQYGFVKFLSNISDIVVVLTQQNAEFIVKNRIYPANKVFEYQNGIPIPKRTFQKDNARARLISRFNLNPDSQIVLTPVRMAPEKNVDLIIRIARKVINECPNVAFLIAGNGPLLNSLKEEVSANNLNKNIHFIGFFPDIYSLLQGSDVFLLPSFLELHSIAILEAMISKVPVVVSSNVGCNSEFIISNKNGMLRDPFVDVGWSDDILYLLKNSDKSREIAENAYKTCVDLFDIKIVANKFEKIYDKLGQNVN